MAISMTRRDLLKAAAVPALLPLLPQVGQARPARVKEAGVSGHLTGAEALIETLMQEGTGCVFGIPGAQENEVWDTMKQRGLGYLLVTHEFSAAGMADGYARATGRPGVLFVIPGPGVTNSLSGLGEALLDSVPVVCIVGDISRGPKYHPFQVHELPQIALLQPVTKAVLEVTHVAEIPLAVRQAFALACSGEPGPVGVVIPNNLFIEKHKFHCPPLAPPPVPFDEPAFQKALALLADPKRRIGIYAGLGCMDYSASLVKLAETLQVPVATSVSGKGVIPKNHPLSVGWGYGPQGTRTAERAFKQVDTVLAIGVRYSEVSTAAYSIPPHRCVIHVDINAQNLGRAVKATVCVHADAGVFLDEALAHAEKLCRPPDRELEARIRLGRQEDAKEEAAIYSKCGVDPMAFILALRRTTCADAQVFVDVTLAEHLAAQAFTVCRPRTYFNPADNQSMGWSIPASLGAQRAFPGRQTVTITGDGCFLMSAMEISTAAREGLAVKFFVFDDQVYQYMQTLQKPAYLRTTATVLARLDYPALAQGFGVGYHEIRTNHDLEAGIRGALCLEGPVLTRVTVDWGKRKVRWVEAVKDRFTEGLTNGQKARFLGRMGARALDFSPMND